METICKQHRLQQLIHRWHSNLGECIIYNCSLAIHIYIFLIWHNMQKLKLVDTKLKKILVLKTTKLLYLEFWPLQLHTKLLSKIPLIAVKIWQDWYIFDRYKIKQPAFSYSPLSVTWNEKHILLRGGKHITVVFVGIVNFNSHTFLSFDLNIFS